ncbi:Wzz/FepE/Etk N-terminal domain-containing protein [Pseudoalteromonas xiamenensis]
MQYSEAQLIKYSEIDVQSLFRVVWKGKWIIAAITTLSIAAGVWFSLSLPNVYTSTTLLAKVEEGKSGGLSSLKSEFGGFAALAGVSLGAKGGNNTDLALQILKSRQFVNEFVNKYKLKAVLMATTSWDKDNDKLIYNPEIYDVKSETWKVNQQTGKSFEPMVQEVRDYFIGKIIGIEEDNKKGLVTITVTHLSPRVAKEISDKLVSEINLNIQNADIEEAVTRITYLKKALLETPIADMQKIFYQLIEQQEQKKMLAQTQNQYVFKVIDPAIEQDKKSGPRRALICIAAAFAGGVFSLFLVIAFHYLVTNRSRK